MVCIKVRVFLLSDGVVEIVRVVFSPLDDGEVEDSFLLLLLLELVVIVEHEREVVNVVVIVLVVALLVLIVVLVRLKGHEDVDDVVVVVVGISQEQGSTTHPGLVIGGTTLFSIAYFLLLSKYD